MKILPLELKVIIGLAAITAAVALPHHCTAGATSTTLQIESLQREYTATAQQVRQGRQHMLRLEGAISILQQQQDDLATATQVLQPEANDTPTTATGHADY